jgi:hypothetical protein
LADCEVSVDFVGTALSEAYITFRYSDNTNWWRIGTDQTVAASRIVAEKFVAGVLTRVVTGTSGRKLRLGDRLRVVGSGTTFSIYRNNDLVVTVTDAHNATATSHGVQITAGTVRLDNFGVKPPA